MRTADRILAWISGFFAVAAAAILAASTVALIVNVALRALGGRVIFGMVDMIELGLMACTFLGAPWVLRQNGHVAVDLFLSALSDRGRARMGRATSLIGMVLALVVCWASLQAMGTSFARGSVVPGVLRVPDWIPLLAPVIGMAMLAAEFLLRAVRGQPVIAEKAGL